MEKITPVIERKMGVILWCKLAMHNELMSKLLSVSLFGCLLQIFSAVFLPNIIRIDLQLGKLSQK